MLRMLRRKLEGDRPSNPEAEAAAIERLLEAGLRAEARARFAAAAVRWPQAEAIDELRGQLESGTD